MLLTRVAQIIVKPFVSGVLIITTHGLHELSAAGNDTQHAHLPAISNTYKEKHSNHCDPIIGLDILGSDYGQEIALDLSGVLELDRAHTCLHRPLAVLATIINEDAS